MLDLLPKIPLFDGLELEQIEMLKPMIEQLYISPDTYIIRQGESAIYLYLILHGKAAIHYKPYDGPSLVLTHLRTGDVFGWSAVVGSHFYTSSISSDTELEALRIPGKDLLSLLKSHPKTGKIILGRLVQSVSPRWENAHEQAALLLNAEP